MILGCFEKTVIFIVAIGSYFARPWSCGYALGRFSPEENVPYAGFDYHGMGAISGWLLALLYAVPFFLLIRATLIRPSTQSDPRLADASGRRLGVSLLFLLIFAAPTYTQICYLLALPASLTMPIVLSSAAWFGITTIIWLAAISRPDATAFWASIRSKVGTLAAFIALPKIALLFPLLLRAA
ncbi:hypothetical protein CLG96_05370 [Sphingomonas oleivorans]|uniref:Uncharacterized protein n=1 Tax=Sphingomonas oleivorans TaxID=1735121 RepID=A0A2T5FZ73_9SPHN|nr:hypothetical protein [Sphingomonas oleivorans]PTQ12011.1 hypothetical protein CLG96_05370 [Sphingomonas oleivorans]